MKARTLTFLIVICTIILSPINIYAKSGCCSQHGGVAGCDSSTGFQKCKDGTTSPSCKCDESTVKPVKEVKVVKTTKASKKETAPAVIVPATKIKATTAYKTTGCCSGHGGVGGCDKKTGFVKCKDGTQSSTCTCPKTKSKK